MIRLMISKVHWRIDWRKTRLMIEIFLFQVSLNAILLQIASSTIIMEQLRWKNQIPDWEPSSTSLAEEILLTA
jgi:hypothetical protein